MNRLAPFVVTPFVLALALAACGPFDVGVDDDDGGAEGEAASGACDGACDAGDYTTCSCGTDDPCAWNGDGVCDTRGCASVLSPSFQDTDCTVCGGVPYEGECVDDNTLQFCADSTGTVDATPFIDVIECPALTTCAIENGVATCKLADGLCKPGVTFCDGSATLVTCASDGSLDSTPCETFCDDSAIGSYCSTALPSTVFASVLTYETKSPDAAFNDWNVVNTVPAVGLTVVSLRGEQVIDAGVTDADGAFAVFIPDPPQAGDIILALAIRPRAGGLADGVAFAVAEPDVPDGDVSSRSPIPAETSSFWSWSIDPTVVASGTPFTISEAAGSGALRVFDYLRFAYDTNANNFSSQGKSIVVWLRFNTAWSCGTCFRAGHFGVKGFDLDSAIFMPATAEDQSYWADPVTVHELGHWTMTSFGTSPHEGGTHCIGSRTPPGMAWSEGFATWFSSAIRDDSVYYDKQNGSMFHLDIDLRQYSSSPWLRPEPSAGLFQLIDENEVAAMLWKISETEGDAAIFTALESPRMTQSPFARGYTTRDPWDVDANCEPISPVPTAQSAPFLADMLDALVCSGASTSSVDAATEPSVHYPYPSDAPLCP